MQTALEQYVAKMESQIRNKISLCIMRKWVIKAINTQAHMNLKYAVTET